MANPLINSGDAVLVAYKWGGYLSLCPMSLDPSTSGIMPPN